MGKRYYCEYCDRSFKDSTTSRKNHLKSLAHQQNKKAWYDSFKDKRTKLSDELAKKPCNTYQLKGTCPFGNQCRYRHLTEQEVHNLKSEVERESTTETLDENLTVKNWLKGRTFQTNTGRVNNKEDSAASTKPQTHFPKELAYLPLSLQPTKMNTLTTDCTSAEWD